jgi:hypothetical protein
MDVADELVRRLIACGVSPLEIKGCSDADIRRLQAKAGAPLPESYVAFLRLVGRGAGEFMSDLTAFYPALLRLTDERKRDLARYAVLPDDAFVIADRYGEQTVYIRLSEGPADSPVYYWNGERPRKTRKAFKSVWGFVEDELKGYEYACGD